jgi:hypothetical protein
MTSARASSRRRAATDGISDVAVAAKTGRRWEEWHALLDGEGAEAMSHRDIARHLAERHSLSPWWSQMVTVAYERARGRRQVHERSDGFSAGVSRTLPFSAAALFAAWAEKSRRALWLPDPYVEVRTGKLDRSLRLTWIDGTSRVDVAFNPKGDARCQVVVQHERLKDADAVARMKAYWADALERLRVLLQE